MYFLEAQNNKTPWIMEEDEDEFDGENQEDGDTTESGEPSIGGSSDLPCSIDGLPLVVDQIKLMGFKNECSSVSNINTGSSTSISIMEPPL